MKKSGKIMAAGLGAVILGASLGGCDPEGPSSKKSGGYYGESYRVECETTTERRNKNLFGVMYIVGEGHTINGWDYRTGFQLMHNLGVGMVRYGIEGNCFPTLTMRDEDAIKLTHDMAAEAKKQGIELIWSCYFDYRNNQPNWSDSGIYRKDDREGSAYMKWLGDCASVFRRAAEEFPEATVWELGNEPNGNKNYTDGTPATYEEWAQIYADYMYYASEAIHSVNPDAVVMMGAFTEPEGLGRSGNISYTDAQLSEKWGRRGQEGRAVSWLNYIYDYIESGAAPSMYPDDYFQCGSWHPYTFDRFDADYFVQENQKFYDVIKTREGKDKRCYITEFGFSDGFAGADFAIENDADGAKRQALIADYTVEMYETVRDRMPYIESVCYFRAFNDTRDKYWAGDSDDFGRTISMYGLFYDPNPDFKYRDYYPRETEEGKTPKIPTAGAPKPVAYAYQQLAGGAGPLDLFVEK